MLCHPSRGFSGRLGRCRLAVVVAQMLIPGEEPQTAALVTAPRALPNSADAPTDCTLYLLNEVDARLGPRDTLHGRVKFVPSKGNWFSLVPEPNAETVGTVPLDGDAGEIPVAALGWLVAGR